MPDESKVPIPRVAFNDVFEKAQKLGLEPRDLKKLEALDFISPQKPTKSRSHFLFILLLLVSGIYYGPPISGSRIAELFRKVSKPKQDFCLLDFHVSTVGSVFRRLENCDECRNIRHVERVANITQAEFETKFAYTKRPVVITDAVFNWTAPQVFSYDYFKRLYKDEGRESCWFDPYKSGFKTLREVFDMSDARARMEAGTKPWYVGWSNCDPSAAAELRRHYTRPYFLPREAESSKTDWIFMGSSGYGAPLHVDNVNLPSWQAQITGQKLWTLKPPLECAYQCPSQLQVTVNPGEIIVLDTNTWYHSTLITSKDMSITIGSEFD